MHIFSVISSEKRTIIGACNGSYVTTESFDGETFCAMSSWTVDSDVSDILLTPRSSHSGFLLIAATKSNIVISLLNVLGEDTGHVILSHSMKDIKALKLGYIPCYEAVIIPRYDDVSLIFNVGTAEAEVELREVSLKLDSTRMLSPVTGHDLILSHVCGVSALQPYTALLSQSNVLCYL